MAAFTPAGSGGATSSVVVEGSSNPIVSNISLPIADTEIAILLPNDCKQFLLKLRNPRSSLKLGYVSGQSGVTYLTVPPGNFYSDSDLDVSGVYLYVQSPEASQIVELVTWS